MISCSLLPTGDDFIKWLVDYRYKGSHYIAK
jgi:hypothetical protein